MTILHRYIAKTVIVAIFMVMMMVMALSFFISVLGEFRDIGIKDYGFLEAMLHSLLFLPSNLYQFFPMVVLLGGILGLGMLASNQELMVMRASGVSFQKIIKAVVTGALVFVLVVTLVGEWVAPHANFLASKRKGSAQNGGQAVATATGVWIHEGDSFFHIKQVTGLHHLEGVTRYQFDATHHLMTAYYAKAMDFEHDHWSMRDLIKTNFSADSITSELIPASIWNVTLNPNLLMVGMIEPEEMTLKNLYSYTRHLQENGLGATEFQFSFWKRLFQPLATIAMILLAIPFVLTISRSTIIGWRIFMGVMLGFAFYIINAFLGQLCVVFQLSPWFAALFPILLFASLGYGIGMKLSR